nr:MAG TPA: hypothetical protein [Caudoviricetes sp.]
MNEWNLQGRKRNGGAYATAVKKPLCAARICAMVIQKAADATDWKFPLHTRRHFPHTKKADLDCIACGLG